MTWTLILFIGLVPPLLIEDYTSKANCEKAGQQAVAEYAKRRAGHQGSFYCIEVS
jgi:hypothetical protein